MDLNIMPLYKENSYFHEPPSNHLINSSSWTTFEINANIFMIEDMKKKVPSFKLGIDSKLIYKWFCKGQTFKF